MDYIPIGKIVRNKRTGEIGFTVPDNYGCCLDDEALVNYEGDYFADGTKFKDLEIIEVEMPKADPEKCGMGKLEKCCIFLVVDANGFRCERFTSNRQSLTLRKDKMTAQRHPKEMYPKCQIF